MPSASKKLPGVLMLLLSALGILFGLLIAAGVLLSFQHQPHSAPLSVEQMSAASSGALALLVALLQFPTLIIAVRSLRGKTTLVKFPSLFKAASLTGLVWLGLIVAGILAVRAQINQYIFIPLNLMVVAIPVWWLVEFGRRGLSRSTSLREWGTLAIGLSAAPLLIMTIEIAMAAAVTLAVLVVFLRQPDYLNQLGNITQNFGLYQGGIEQLEQLIIELARNPVIASALFLLIGIFSPLVEELIKPMALWFLLNRPLKESEGFSLGLISGGAFALLESGGLVGQVSLETWAQVVILRAATGLLHISLSGFVGYKLVANWNRKRYGYAILNLVGAAGLHGAWNSLALLSSFSAVGTAAAGAADFQPTPGNILSLAGIFIVFGVVFFLVLHINHALKKVQVSSPEKSEPPAGFAAIK